MADNPSFSVDELQKEFLELSNEFKSLEVDIVYAKNLL